MKPNDYFGNLGIGGDLHNGNISILLSVEEGGKMTLFMWITIALMLLALVIANSDEYLKVQWVSAVVLYLLLTIQTILWIAGG